ncbi:MAG: hypothetical protein ABFR19_00900 [Pseudomonadota bacterium]
MKQSGAELSHIVGDQSKTSDQPGGEQLPKALVNGLPGFDMDSCDNAGDPEVEIGAQGRLLKCNLGFTVLAATIPSSNSSEPF